MTEENQTELPEPGRTIAGVLTVMAGSLAAGVVTPAEEPHHQIATLPRLPESRQRRIGGPETQ